MNCYINWLFAIAQDNCKADYEKDPLTAEKHFTTEVELKFPDAYHHVKLWYHDCVVVPSICTCKVIAQNRSTIGL